MIDIKLIRQDPDLVKENIKKKFQNHKIKLVDEVLVYDAQIRDLKHDVEQLRSKRNKLSEEINQLKKAGKEITSTLKEVKEIPAKIKDIEDELFLVEEKLKKNMLAIPNFIHESVPLGKDSSENVEKEKIGKPKHFTFEPKHHVELAENLGIADFESSARTSGTGFYFLDGDLALLNQAVIRYAVDFIVKKGFTYIETPLMLNDKVIKNVTDLNDMNNQIYKIQNEDLYLIGTSEHSMIGRFIDSVILEEKLPLKMTSYSMCFRKEIGSHGIDEKGLFRTHQFNKIEMIVICKDNINASMGFFEEMKESTIELFKSLEIPIRVLMMCSGDLGDLKHIQVDIEAWSPRKKEYYEIGSCSNLTDAQARRLNIKYTDGKERNYVHTLNNTVVATSRALVAILENNQNEDGSVNIPKILMPYMHGKTKIERRK